MFKSRVLSSALVVVAVAAASVFAAAPASAATLPAGQRITVIDSDTWQFYEASPADASLTAVGTGVPGEATLTGVDVDDDGHGFAVATDYSEGPIGAWIFTADANTGLLADPVQVTVSLPEVDLDADECTAIDYTAGVVYAACVIYSEGFTTFVGPIDPVTGVLVPEVQLSSVEEDVPGFLTAIAIDPISGTLYGFMPSAWTLAASGSTLVTDIVNPPVFGADFDRDGQLWITTNVAIGEGGLRPVYPALATLSLTDGSSPFLEPYTLGGTLLGADIQPITVWGKAPALAATGVNQSPAVALGAGALLLFGAVLAAGAAATRRRSLES